MAVSLHGNNGLVTTNGTAAAPSLAAPDTDTGLYFGTNLIHATTDGTERLRILSDGRVGVNTDDPRFNNSSQISSASFYHNDPKFGVKGSIVIGNLSATATDERQLAFYRRGGSSPGTSISTHKMGRIAWYGSSNDTNLPDLAYSIACVPNGGGWTAGSNRRASITFNNHDSEVMRLTSGGNVAIGNASPQQLLHVWPDTANTTSAYVRVTAGDRNSNTGIDIGHDASGDGRLNVVSNGSLRLYTNNTERLRIDSSGNTNFGAEKAVALPSGTGIQVYNSSAPRIKLVNDTTGNAAGDGFQLYLSGSGVIFDQKESAEMRFYTSAIEKVRITSTGLVGIGEVSPSYILDVKGDSGITQSPSSNSTAGQVSIVGRNSGGSASAISRLKSYPDGSSNQSHFAIETRNSSAAMVERLRIDSDGRLGINGAGIKGMLEVRASGGLPAQLTAVFGANEGTTAGTLTDNTDKACRIGVQNYDTDAKPFTFLVGSSTSGVNSLNIGGGTSLMEGATQIIFSTDVGQTNNGGTARLKITSGGQVQLPVNGQELAWGASQQFRMFWENSEDRMYLKGNGAYGLAIRVNNGNRIEINKTTGDVIMQGASGRNFQWDNSDASLYLTDSGSGASARLKIGSGADLQMYHDTGGANHITCANNHDLKVSVADLKLYDYTGVHHKMTMDSNGDVKLGTAGSYRASEKILIQKSAGYNETVVAITQNNGTVTERRFLYFFNSAGNAAGSVRHTGATSVQYHTSSDYRLKENVVDITDGISRIKQLKPKRFNFKTEPDETVDGFLAHEVSPVIPDAVSGEKDGEVMQSLGYERLTPLLAAALKEAIAKIETLETEVAALKSA